MEPDDGEAVEVTDLSTAHAAAAGGKGRAFDAFGKCAELSRRWER